MTRTEKEQSIEHLNRVFRENAGVFLLSFKGIDGPDITELRRQVRRAGCEYEVVKNRLARRAAKQTAAEKLDDYFSGPTAVAYTQQDPIRLAKAVKAFASEHPGFELKAGVLENSLLSAQEVEQLADMPSREELLSKLIYLLQSPLTRLASTLQTPVRNLGSVLKQLADARSE